MGHFSVVVLVLNIEADSLVMHHRLIGLIVLSGPPICVAVPMFFSPKTQDGLSRRLRYVSPILNPFFIFLQYSLQPLLLEFSQLLNALVQVMLGNCQQTVPCPLNVEMNQCIVEELSLFGFKLLLKSSIGQGCDYFFYQHPIATCASSSWFSCYSCFACWTRTEQFIHILLVFFHSFFARLGITRQHWQSELQKAC